MPSRTVTSRQTSLGGLSRKPVGTSLKSSGHRATSHQDTRSLLIAAVLAMALASMVGGVWYYLKTAPEMPSGHVMRAAPTAADLAAKKTHSYWKVGQETYRHYITDTTTGEIIDAGNITVKEMLDEGIEVPGYSLPNKAARAGGADTGSEALAVRFKALQDHLK